MNHHAIKGNALGLLRVSEAARLMGVSQKTIRKRIHRGELAHRRFGWLIFIDAADLIPQRVANEPVVESGGFQ